MSTFNNFPDSSVFVQKLKYVMIFVFGSFNFKISHRPTHEGVGLMMSVLPLLTDRGCLVLVVKTNARFQSP